MTDTTKIVQAIRVAQSLTERVRVLTQPAELGAEQLSRQLGELRQLYPEMWSQLDTARDQLAALGRDVTRYDALRSNPITRAGGVLDVRLGEGSAGCTLALEGGYTLRALLPEVDWLGLEDAEAAELAQIGSLGPAPWKGWVLGLLAFGILGAVLAIVIYLQITSSSS